MKDFFKGVRKHIGKLDAEHLREQYEIVTDELAHSEMIFHTMSEGYVVLDASGAVQWSNPAAEKLAGIALDDFIRELALPLAKASKREIAITYPEARALEIQTIPMSEDTLVKIADVTDRHARTEEELRAGATEAVSYLASGMAHEIGNPLNAIALNIQMLERDPTDHESIDIIKSQVKRLDGIIRGFLEALRPIKPKLAPSSPSAPLKNCLAAMKRQFEERSIRIILDLPTALPPVAIDSDQMEQVFFNLTKNAMEAMKDGSELAFSLTSDDRDIVISITDTGAGMSAEQVAHLFEPYRTNKAKGNGLGLMITKRIIEAHGGTIAAESAIGVGTKFTIRLPRLEKRVRELQ